MKLPCMLLAALALASGCAKTPPAEEKHEKTQEKPEHADEAEHAEPPKRVRIAKEVIEQAKIRTELVKREILPVTLALPGEIAPDPDKSARVAAPVAGRIEKLSLKEGGSVKKGDVLVVIRVPEIGRLRAERAGATAKAKAARSNAKRLRSLLDKKLASDQQVLDAESEADALDAEARGFGDQLAALGGGGASSIALRAPVSGVVVARDAVVGQAVTPEQTLATIADLAELWFLGRVFEKDLGRLSVGAKTEVELNAYPERRFAGSLEYVGKQVDPVARTLTARIRVQNQDDLLRIGLFGTTRVELGGGAERAATLVVPRGAVTDVAGKTCVFVSHPDGDFELHPVVLGEAAPGKVEIVSGVREGEAVVSEGVFSVKSALLRSTFAEEEEH